MAASIHDVAKRAGVSISTVSRVINHPESVKEQKRIAVQEAMEFYDYEPNQFGRGLVKQSSGIIGVHFASAYGSMYDNSYNLELLKGIDEVITKQGYTLLIINEKKNSKKVGFVEYANQKKIDGLLLSGLKADEASAAERNKLIKMEFPFVYIGKKSHKHGYNVYAQYEQYMFEMIERLHKAGHRKILMLVSEQHKKMYQKVQELVCNETPQVELFTEYIQEEHRVEQKKIMLDILEKYVINGGCTAMGYPGMDTLSMVFGCCNLLNISIPNDLSIISVEHKKGAGISFYPEVDSYYVPAEEMGKAAAKMLLKCICGEEVQPSQEFDTLYFERNTLKKRK